MATLRLGTCSFTARGWKGRFYPPGLADAAQLSWYATQFDTLEIDSSFYAVPAPEIVKRWYESTPESFLFALKFPKTFTHEKLLADCRTDLAEFLESVSNLKEKLGPLLLQFPYFRRGEVSPESLHARLRRFLPLIPPDVRVAVEIRNRWWLKRSWMDLLHRYNAAAVLIDHPYMCSPAELISLDPITTDFAYLRLLGDRKAIEEKTLVWNEVIEDRSSELRRWVDICRAIVRRGVDVHVYVNNHYSGYAPATALDFRELWNEGTGAPAQSPIQ